jgi:hypothetical protein
MVIKVGYVLGGSGSWRWKSGRGSGRKKEWLWMEGKEAQVDDVVAAARLTGRFKKLVTVQVMMSLCSAVRDSK